MNFVIKQNDLVDNVKKQIDHIFHESTIENVGMDGLENPPVSFEILNDHELIGAVVVRIFWGQLHIKNLAVSKKYRGLNLAKKLMERAFAYGRAQGCTFAFVETMNFQAPEFYQKLGFKVDFVRSGYAKDTSFYYLRKNL